jgi:hypothetical protein
LIILLSLADKITFEKREIRHILIAESIEAFYFCLSASLLAELRTIIELCVFEAADNPLDRFVVPTQSVQSFVHNLLGRRQDGKGFYDILWGWSEQFLRIGALGTINFSKGHIFEALPGLVEDPKSLGWGLSICHDRRMFNEKRK